MIYPAPLQKGSTIGIIAPSGGIRKSDAFAEGIRILHELGYKTKFPRQLWPGNDYLADSDANRVAELQSIWTDEKVDAVMAARGGYGCLRLMREVQNRDFFSTPKVFIGFSDITLLHSHINNHHGLVTFHGPVVTSLTNHSHDSIQEFDRLLRLPPNRWNSQPEVDIVQGGRTVCGISTGGNLSSIVSTLGTPFMPDWRKKIVFLEDTSEPTYRVDKMLTQLKLAGMFDEVRAIILGDFSHGLGLDRNGLMRHHEAIWSRVQELVERKVAIWTNYPIGHGTVNMILPLGLEITIDSQKKRLYSN